MCAACNINFICWYLLIFRFWSLKQPSYLPPSREWLEGVAALVDCAVFSYLAVLPSHSAQSLTSLRQQETDFCISLLRTKVLPPCPPLPCPYRSLLLSWACGFKSAPNIMIVLTSILYYAVHRYDVYWKGLAQTPARSCKVQPACHTYMYMYTACHAYMYIHVYCMSYIHNIH